MDDIEEQTREAKFFLLKTSRHTKNNLYDHLSDCLALILKEKTQDAVDIFENISDTMKKEKLQASGDTIQDSEGPSDRVDLAEKQKELFQKPDAEAEADVDEEVSTPYPDLMDVSRSFEACGVGLSREEYFRVNLALKKLCQDFPLSSARFWGKVFGTKANYIIAEAEFQEGEGEEEEEEEEKEEEKAETEPEPEDEETENDGSESEKDEPPKSQWKPLPTVPKEEFSTGANKKTYFVCNNPGETWVRLPLVTPAQVAIARDVKKMLTGNLKAPVTTFPPFPGSEMNYLRAQIARISATTHISPQSYFQSPEEEDEEDPEEGGLGGAIEPNPEFICEKISDYLDISNWCHHVHYLLPQGRTLWWNPVQKAEDEFEEEEYDEDDEKEQPEEPEPEDGPKILTSAAEDAKVDGMPAWSTKLSSSILPNSAVAIASSNLWPGAHSYTAGNKCENIYIGWGMKYSARPFNPSLPPTVQEEFPGGADITETLDPTAEQEKALRAAQEEAQAQLDEEEEPDEESDDD